MKKIILAAVAILFLCVGCMAKNQSKRFVVNDKFSAIDVSGNIEVVYTVAPTVGIKTIAPAEVLSGLDINVKGQTLVISYAGSVQNYTAKVYLDAPAVASITAAGNSSVKVPGTLNGSEMKFHAAGNAEIKIGSLIATGLELTSQGNSEFTFVNVMCESLTGTLQGNSEVEVRSITGNSIKITAQGNSDFEGRGISVETVNMTAQGNSKVELAGHAYTVDYRSSGCATIDSRRLAANGGNATAQGNSIILSNVAGLVSSASSNAEIKNVNV